MATANKLAFDKIRNAIFAGKYPPGYQLKEEELANELNISRTPVRQAIRALVDEGMVEIRPNRRSYVADIDQVQFEELFDLLSFLESYSAGLATDKIPDDAIAYLKELNKGMGETVISQNNSRFLELNSEFHSTIHSYAGSAKVDEFLGRIIQFPHNLYLKFGQIPDWHNAKSVIEHQQIIDALESRDLEFVKVRMKSHTESVRIAFRELWDENFDPDTDK